MRTYQLHQYPYIRLIIPWIAGVFCGDHLFDRSLELSWGILVFCLLTCLLIGLYFLQRYSLRWCFGVAVFAICFMGGWTGITRQLKQTVFTFPKEEVVYRVSLTDAPKAKERTYLCPAFVKESRDSVGDVCPVGKKVIFYLEKDSTVAQLKRGDELWLSSRIAPPVNGKNFDEFDYARYLLYQGVSGTGYVTSGKWMLTSSVPVVSARLTANSYRDKVISLYRELGFTGDELAVLSALTVGDKTELSTSVRESYSVAGASHILALSGLHIGILCSLLLFVLKPVAQRGFAGRLFCSVLLLILLWTFAFFTGLSASVVRSVGMFSILALAKLFTHNTFTLNTLAATAWIMLLCNPVWLFDVGFQLSFSAVASILLLQQPIYQLFPVRTKVGKYVWGLMSVSIAAQLGTAPLVMFYFSSFSTHFLLTNLVVIPLIVILLYTAVLMLLLTPLVWIQSFVVVGVRLLLSGLNAFVRWVEQLPYASINGIWLYRSEVLGIYIFMLVFLYYGMNHRRQTRNLVMCLCGLCLLGTYHATMCWLDRPQASLVFYNVRGCPAVHCIESGGRSWINYVDTLADKKRLKQVATNYWNHHRLLPPEEITTDCRCAELSRQQQIISYRGCRVCMVTDNRWRNKTTISPLYIQYLYLCNGYDGRVEELLRLFPSSFVILDASLPEYRKRLLEKECKQSGLRFISLSEEGSVCFLL